MAKLYLIRRNLETFTGPMSLAEMKDSYKRMQFGLQDEVSGHCGPWVAFDSMEKIKKHYPEIARIVNEDMLAGWGVSHPGERIVNDDTKRLEVTNTKGVGLALTFLAIALAAFAAAVYMASSAKLSGKTKDQPEGLRPGDPQGLLDKNDLAGFDQYMLAHSGEMVDRVNKAKTADQQAPWLPYLRLFAFNHDGQLAGLDAKVLRGSGAAAAPIDCSLRMWKREWRASMHNWNDFVVQRKLVRAHWARLLAWDPHWIRRRDNKGWLGNQNFYTSCIVMAGKALDELATDTSLVGNASDWEKLGFSKVRQRLAWLLDVARQGQSTLPSAPGVDNNLALWSCFEGAHDMAALAHCRGGMSSDQDIWQAYVEERYGWNMLRLATGQKGTLSVEQIQGLTAQAAKMNNLDHFTRFDYRAEARLLKTVVKLGTTVEKAVEKTQTEFPDVRLSH